MTTQVARAGVVLALLYAVVALVTSALSSRPVLPLFDGFAPPVPYNWVTPPLEVAAANTVPTPFEREFPLGPDGSDATNASTEDAQVIVGLDKGSVAPRPPDTAVKVAVVPMDASRLGQLPPGLRPVSNAYQVVLSYVPSQEIISSLAVKGTVALTAAEAGDRLLYSPDGAQWQERLFKPYGQDNGLFTDFEAGGYFVVASSTVPQHASPPASRNAILLGIAAVVPIIAAALVLRLPSPFPATPVRTTRRPVAKPSRPPARKKARRAGRKPGKRRRR